MRAGGMIGYHIGHQTVARDVHVIAVGGELDMKAAPELRAAIDRALESKVSLLVVDLSDATFIDSTAIGALVAAVKRLRESGGALELVCCEPNVLRVFELTGLDNELSIHFSREDALGTPARAGGGAISERQPQPGSSVS
jgi:anti-sigma B factor antagonist